jgi:hypothetical protein
MQGALHTPTSKGPRVLTPASATRWQHVGHPAIAPILLALLLASVLLLPLAGARIYGRWETTVLKYAPWLERFRPARHNPSVVFDLYFVPNHEQKPAPLNPTDYSADAMQRIWKGDPAVWVGLTFDVRRIGWFAPTIETTRFETRLQPNPFKPDHEWSKSNLESSKAAFAAILRDPKQKNRPDLATLFLDGDAIKGRTLWWGIAWNTATLATLALFCTSLIIQPAWWRRRISLRRLRRNHCGRCNYSLEATQAREGHDAKVQCPECGEQWGVEDVPT